MDYNHALKFLYRLEGKKYNLSLDAIIYLLKKLDNPQQKLKVIHVAGTNGKGSTCAMISSILIQAGYRVGMYTSPHLIRFNERIQINGKSISDSDLLKYFNKAFKAYKNETFFEFTTAMAFLYFFEKKVDYLVLEVGLGGRLDATNVVDPLVSVITNIGLEHTEYLGKTIGKIAYEKSGIIKERRPVVTGAVGEALDVISKSAKQKRSKLYVVRKDGKHLKLGLNGEFQRHNALMAIKTIEVLRLGIDKKIIDRGLLSVKWPGRLEFISDNILVDCAHNLHAVKVLKRELVKIKKKYKRIILVIGILSDKKYNEMLNALEPVVDYFVITRPSIKRAASPSTLFKFVKKDKKIIDDVKEAFEYAKKTASKYDLILVTGSIYTVGEVFGRE
ncbi:MAG: folylpolyglutamate synthase/dihydrofolate synthase family protein [Nanoarchaeota archaeon]